MDYLIRVLIRKLVILNADSFGQLEMNRTSVGSETRIIYGNEMWNITVMGLHNRVLNSDE